jgi:hypothetical protein
MDNIKIIKKTNGYIDMYLNDKKLSGIVEIDVKMYMLGEKPMTNVILKQEFINASVIIEDEPRQGTGTWIINEDGKEVIELYVEDNKILEEMAKSINMGPINPI